MSPPMLAKRLSRLEASPIREILSVASQPGMISFAGGLPSKESFPIADELSFQRSDLQYGPSEGEPRLRELVAKELSGRGLDVPADRILILSGSQQGIDLVSKLLIEDNTEVAVESPTYLAALQVFNLFGAKFCDFTIDEIQRGVESGNPELLYAIPTFQNPSSRNYTFEERMALADFCDRNNTVLFEDDPYRDLMYERCERQSVCSMIKKASWVYQSSFSKTIAPGLRVGYLTCSEDLFPYLLRLKQAADLHSCRVSQAMVQHVLQDSTSAVRLINLKDTYKKKRDAFDECLNRNFNKLASWDIPAGGLFFWLTLKQSETIDTRKLLPKAISNQVTFMPGEPFYSNSQPARGCFRLNFSHASEDDMEVGLKRLAEVFENNGC